MRCLTAPLLGPVHKRKRNSCEDLSHCGSSEVNPSITTYFLPSRIFPVEECTTTGTAKWMLRWPRPISAKVCVLNAFLIGIIEILCVMMATHNWLECVFFITIQQAVNHKVYKQFIVFFDFNFTFDTIWRFARRTVISMNLSIWKRTGRVHSASERLEYSQWNYFSPDYVIFKIWVIWRKNIFRGFNSLHRPNQMKAIEKTLKFQITADQFGVGSAPRNIENIARCDAVHFTQWHSIAHWLTESVYISSWNMAIRVQFAVKSKTILV